MTTFIDTQEAADTDAIATINIIVVHASAHPPCKKLINVEYRETEILSNAYLAALMGAEHIAVAITVKGDFYVALKKTTAHDIAGYALMSAKDARRIAGRYWKNKDVRDKIQGLLTGVIERSYT